MLKISPQLATVSLLLGLVGCGGGGASESSSAASTSSPNSPASSTNNRLIPPAPPSRPNGSVQPRYEPQVSAPAERILPRTQPLVVSFQSGWNLFSMPFSPPTSFNLDQPANLLACARYDANSGAYVDQPFNAGAFASSNPLTGYWVYCTNPTQLTLDGGDQTQKTLTLNMAPGWNLVGTPLSVDVATSDLNFNATGLPGAFTSLALWPGVLAYNGSGYSELGHPPTVLPAARAQWIYAYQAGVLTRPTQNLVVNPSFEQPVAPVGGFTLVNSGNSSTIPGWRVVGPVGGNVAVIGNNFVEGGFTFQSDDGVQAVDLTGGTNVACGLEQTFTTIPGRSYNIAFSIGNVVGGPYGVSSTVNVLVNGTQVFSATNSDGTGSTNLTWRRYNTNFVAAGSSTAIAFINGDPATDSSNFLDTTAVTLNP
jgi:hypothetical protein